MVDIVFSGLFERDIKQIKDKILKEKIKKQIRKIINDPEAGKPLKYNLKNERTLYIKPYRLIYAIKKDEITLLRFCHRDEVYK